MLPGFIQQRLHQYRSHGQAFYRNPVNRIASSLRRQPASGVRIHPFRANRFIRNEHLLYNAFNRIQTREPLRNGARRPLNYNFQTEFPKVASGKSKIQIDDNDRSTRRMKLSRTYASNTKWRKTPVSLNLGEKYTRRIPHNREGNGGSFRLGRNEYAPRHRLSIKSSRGRNIHISHFAEPNGRSRIIINTGLGSSEQVPFNSKSNTKSPSRTNSNAATWSHMGKTKTNGTDFLKKVDNQRIASTESATNTDGTNTHISKEITITPGKQKLEKSPKKTDNLTAGTAKTSTTTNNIATKVNNDNSKQIYKVKAHPKSGKAATSTPVILTNKTKEVKKVRSHPGNILEPQLDVTTTEGPDLPDGPDGPDTPDGNDGPDTA